MNMTPKRIQELAEPVEEIYQKIVDDLLVNIGRHLTGNTTTWTAYWEVQKLAEMGQLTAENAAIINRYIRDMPQVLKDTMEATRKQALAQLEAQLAKAAEDGYITPPVSDTVVDILRQYGEQAADRLNMTNTTMLESSLRMYEQAVGETARRLEEIERRAREAANTGAGDIITGAKTRRQVLAETIQRISDAGLTGFYDRAGRSWTPEAYVNMVMRTTVHNTAIQATRSRMQDYNTQVFQISSHAGARPLCYPYQGKFYSWDDTSGEIVDGAGRRIRYEPISSTSYGEAAGIFGINCGHYPIPVIPGVTIPHGEDDIEPEAENKKEYAQSQEQRALEREIRAAKRVVTMGGAVATDEQRAAVRDAQAKMRAFIAQTGRARRYDREQI